MQKLVLLLVVAISIVGCLSKPVPWQPGDVKLDVPPRDGRTMDGNGDVPAATPDVALDVVPDLQDVSPEAVFDIAEVLDVHEVEPPEDTPVVELVDSINELDTMADAADVCVPDCEWKDCGDDGCGGTCGECNDNQDCIDGVCDSPPHHVWSNCFGGFENDYSRSMAVDDSGNVYITGSFDSSSIDFGGDPLENSGNQDIFIAKLDTDGNHVWSDNFGGDSFDEGEALAVGSDGNVCITGSFNSSPIDFGGDPIEQLGGNSDVFLVKLDSEGGHAWSKGFGTPGEEDGLTVAVSSDGSVLVAGRFADSETGGVDFGGGALQNHGHGDMFVAKFGATGDHLWSKGFGGEGDDTAQSLALTGGGDVYVVGTSLSAAIDFGDGPLEDATKDIFAVKLDANGEYLWATRFGGELAEYAFSVSSDCGDNVFFTGKTKSSAIDFGGGPLEGDGSLGDAYVVKLSPGGDHVWSDIFVGDNNDGAYSVFAGPDGGAYLAGYSFSTELNLGGGPLPGGTFIARLDADGDHVWSKAFSGPYGRAIAVDPSGNVYLTTYDSTKDFGGGPIQGFGGADICVAKFSQPGSDCQPDCDGKMCGWDGCWGTCGECTSQQEACVEGVCQCQPACGGKECGDDGCGGECGTCAACGKLCQEGQCVFVNCDGVECGDDGCSGSCGVCTADNKHCSGGMCVCIYEECNEVCCSEDEICFGDVCCLPDCTDKECGSDGCGGECPPGCDDGKPCTTDDCAEGGCSYPVTVGCLMNGDCIAAEAEEPDAFCMYCDPAQAVDQWSPKSDGVTCGNNADCQGGACSCIYEECVDVCCDDGQVCFDQQCCSPACEGKECGDDGCGGSCGECGEETVCLGEQCDWGVMECGGIACPPLAGYSVTCNAQAHCEYANEDESGWKQWDVWLYISPGSFQMGCPPDPEDEDQCSETGLKPSDELPQHMVEIDYRYFISKYEIVVAQYEACNAVQPEKCLTPSTTDDDGAGWGTNYWQDGIDPDDEDNIFHERLDHPQNGLTWQQAGDFCAWTAPGGRLPSEAEWEYAATGPMHATYPWGDSPDPTCSNDTAVFNHAGGAEGYGCTEGGTWSVDSKTAGMSWCGALGMGGNVWEWTQDWYHDNYQYAPDDGSVWDDPSSSSRVIRGGSFFNAATSMRSAERFHHAPGDHDGRFGARCVRPSPPSGCVPDCTDKECGDNGCGVWCGECSGGQNCQAGTCLAAFVSIPAGSFWMGSPAGDGEQCPQGYEGGGCTGDGTGTTLAEPGRDSDETLHNVELTHDFEMQGHEVTQGEWKAAFGNWNPSDYPLCGDNCPVESVSWFDALAFANWRSEQALLTPCYVFSEVKCGDESPVGSSYEICLAEGKGGIGDATVTLADGASTPYECTGYRLPTEAEWEHAARALSLTAFHPSGGNDGAITHIGREPLDLNLDLIGWYGGNSTATYGSEYDCSSWFAGADKCGPQPVGGKEANEQGLKDMSGNVWEWCWDTYCADNTGYGGDPDGSGCENSTRTLRGGSWGDSAKLCRSAERSYYPPDVRDSYRGFRLVRTLTQCSDNECNGGEDCSNCPDDCACPGGQLCVDGDCCMPDCTGKECGDDGCGGSCGACSAPQILCVDGQCGGCDDGNETPWDGCTDGEVTEFQLNTTSPKTSAY